MHARDGGGGGGGGGAIGMNPLLSERTYSIDVLYRIAVADSMCPETIIKEGFFRLL